MSWLYRWSLRIVPSVVILSVALWWGYNRIDEKPSEAALRLSKPFEHTIPDEQNAWLYLLGLGAASDDNPIRLGRERVDIFNARAAKNPTPDVTPEEKNLFVDPVLLKISPREKDGADELCRPQISNCLDWAANHAELLQGLRKDNALLLQRYATLMTLNQYEYLFTPSLEAPYANYSIDRLYLNLIALEVAQTDDRAATLKQIEDSLRFYAMVAARSNTLVEKMTALNKIADRWVLLDVLLSQLNNTQLQKNAAEISAMLSLPDRELFNLQTAFQYEHQMATRASFDLSNSVGDAEDKKLSFWQRLSYAPQATVNLNAQLWEEIIELSKVPAHAYEGALTQYAKKSQKYFSHIDDPALFAPYMWRNFTGKSLVAMSIPAFGEYILRMHDLEGLRRFYTLKLRVRLERIEAQNISNYLKLQGEDLKDPYTNRPFAWDPKLKQLSFVPRSEKWKDQEFIWRMENSTSK